MLNCLYGVHATGALLIQKNIHLGKLFVCVFKYRSLPLPTPYIYFFIPPWQTGTRPAWWQAVTVAYGRLQHQGIIRASPTLSFFFIHLPSWRTHTLSLIPWENLAGAHTEKTQMCYSLSFYFVCFWNNRWTLGCWDSLVELVGEMNRITTLLNLVECDNSRR